MKKFKHILLIIMAVLLILSGAVGMYLNDYYPSDADCISAMTDEDSYLFEIWDDGTRVYLPEGEWDTALVFYPGGKVEYDAYEPLMTRCAGNGVACMLVKMPGNLAVLDPDAAGRVMEQFPEVEHWYLAGHSLGGSMAASFAAKNERVEGLILLAAYATDDVSGIPVLSVYGSEDRVMNREKYDQYRENLPADLTEVVIEGGNHAGFGIYGPQKGDGEASISNPEQIKRTAALILEFVK